MKKRLISLAAVLALLCAGCTGGKTPAGTGALSVWFLGPAPTIDNSFFASLGHRRNAVLTAQPCTLPADAPAIPALMGRLLSGPDEDSGARSPFPNHTALRGWSLEDGLATVDLSEAYGSLSGAQLSLADSCVVLTLCQLPDVERVYLTVDGRPRPFQDRVLTPDDFLFSLDEPETSS